MKTQIARVIMRILTILMVGCIAVVLTNGVLPTMFSSFYYNIGVRTLDPEVFLGAETFSAWLRLSFTS